MRFNFQKNIKTRFNYIDLKNNYFDKVNIQKNKK